MPNYRTLCRRCRRYALIGHAYYRWYRVARAVIGRLADYQTECDRVHTAISTPKAYYRTLCDLVAITSPRCSVKRNLRHAWREFIGQPRGSDMIRSTRAALDHYYKTGEIRGPKTSRFAQVLRGSDNVVVVDTWMARALSVPDMQARNRSTQILAERVVSNVRRRVNWGGLQPIVERARLLTMAETQATIWAGIIRTHYKNGKIPTYRTEDVGLYRTGIDGRLSDIPF